MIINDFNLVRAGRGPDQADAVLIVEPHAVLPLTVTSECFQMIAGRHAQLIKLRNRIELVEFTPRNLP